MSRGVAHSQLELDKNSLATQTIIDNTGDLSESGITATWYHFSEVELELKMAISMTRVVEEKNGGLKIIKNRLLAAPMNAHYQNSFKYDSTGNSMLKARLVSIPPPVQVGDPEGGRMVNTRRDATELDALRKALEGCREG